jgi:haloalkane dehalogenase
MEFLRTPDDRFADLVDYPFAPHYVEVGGARMHYVDEGPAGADPVLLLHGEPTWSFLYRHRIPVLAGAGHRVVAPDLVGFGRSDKPAAVTDHTYDRHLAWVGGFLDALDLERVTLVAQDWGGLIGLRLLVDHPERFARVVASNTGLPTGDLGMPELWHLFRRAINEAETLDIGRFVDAGCVATLSDEVRAGYDAPFPDESYKAGPRAMPELVPYTPDNPASEDNRAAWEVLAGMTVPVLCAFSDSDPITGPGEPLLREGIAGAQGQPHTTITGAGHFVQEDAGPALARVVDEFVRATPAG